MSKSLPNRPSECLATDITYLGNKRICEVNRYLFAQYLGTRQQYLGPRWWHKVEPGDRKSGNPGSWWFHQLNAQDCQLYKSTKL